MILNNMLRLLAKDKLAVFLFHKVPRSIDPLFPCDLDIHGFRRLLDFVRASYEVLPLDDAVARLQANTITRASACITFDDGYADWVDGAVPLLKELSLPATFFITTGLFFGRPMWHERLANIVRHAKGPLLDTTRFRLPPLQISDLAQKRAAIRILEFHFKYLPRDLRDDFLSELEQSVDVTPASLDLFTTEQLREISSQGFGIGSHTVDHPILSLCDKKQAMDEIGGTREILESITRSKISCFAYPNGRPYVDFSSQHIAMAKSAGYDCAVTTQWGTATRGTSKYQIPRFTPWGPDPMHMSFQVIRNSLANPEYIAEIS